MSNKKKGSRVSNVNILQIRLIRQIDFTLGTGTYEPKEHISRVLQF